MRILKALQKYPWVNSIIHMHLTDNAALTAPYHNFNHALVVTENVMKAASFYKIPDEELICAALFHDFNHSMGVLPDRANVDIATEQFEKWLFFYNSGRLDPDDVPIKEISKRGVTDIIKATQYPYVIPADKLTLEQSIIRDSDLLQYMEKDRISHVFLGLSMEMKLPLPELLEKIPEFIEGIVPNTAWMKVQWEAGKRDLLEEIALLSRILLKESSTHAR